MKRILTITFLGLLAWPACAQDINDAIPFAKSITEEELFEDLSIIASDALEGRETGKRGQKMAAAFIKSHFEDLGLTPPVEKRGSRSYLQPVDLFVSIPGDTYFKIGEEKKKNLEDLYYFGSSSSTGEVTMELVFAGKGTEADFEQINVKNKAVFFKVSNPRAWREPHELAKAKGAKIVVVQSTEVEKEFFDFMGMVKNSLGEGRLSLEKPGLLQEISGIFFVPPSLVPDLFNVKAEKLNKLWRDAEAGKPLNVRKIKPANLTFKTEQRVKTVTSENVLGYLEGTDKKDELVVITAHYDHIGKNGEDINNGADDDGSGTCAVLEIAEAFTLAKKEGKGPRRSILFMAVTGEEKGLLGSAYYTDNPVFPLENTVVNLNIDMIGRVDPKHKDNPKYVYLVGSDRLSTELHEISEKVNETFTQLELDYTYNDENHPDRIYYRSDHWNFAKNNIPIIFYFNGVHEDYHRPTDTVDKINMDIYAERTRLVFYTAWVLANRTERITLDKIRGTEVNSNN